MSTSPAATTTLVPMRSARRALIGAVTAAATPKGRVCTPAENVS